MYTYVYTDTSQLFLCELCIVLSCVFRMSVFMFADFEDRANVDNWWRLAGSMWRTVPWCQVF